MTKQPERSIHAAGKNFFTFLAGKRKGFASKDIFSLEISIQSDTICATDYTILQTETFAKWHASLRDLRAKSPFPDASM
ncbi:hypothetical protein [Methylomicrobium sp. Wu6]|uniref:hypothetical protein n=1 Tax=Methylomicrobium sp. Wu6 TaxID=3107928 RepID=UPI002DD65D15|nr:hypothetical protein [Methylomicrobium sp. Wu6]MEC4748535.1 hypothetical protein [Methylomicrobium sp. Wu6]